MIIKESGIQGFSVGLFYLLMFSIYNFKDKKEC